MNFGMEFPYAFRKKTKQVGMMADPQMSCPNANFEADLKALGCFLWDP